MCTCTRVKCACVKAEEKVLREEVCSLFLCVLVCVCVFVRVHVRVCVRVYYVCTHVHV